jgi:hypothetical protein
MTTNTGTNDYIDQMGRCLCGAVEFRAKGPIILNSLCHCQSCASAAASTPVHFIAIRAPLPEITKGHDKVTVAPGHGRMVHGRCSECLAPIYQKPSESYPFVAVFPPTFVDLADQKLPPKYQPQMHINYEKRSRDADDDLPKFKTWPFEEECHRDGSVRKAPTQQKAAC